MHDLIIVSMLFCMVVALLALTRLRPIIIFSLVSAVLYGADVLSLDAVSRNFINPSLLTLVALILIAAVLEKISFIADLTSGSLFKRGSKQVSVSLSVFKVGLVAGVVSAFLNNTAVVAALVGGLKKQVRVPPSKLLLPLSYASIAGGMMTLVGTSTNLIVNSFMEGLGQAPLQFFDFSYIGAPVFVAVLIVLTFGAHRSLTHRGLGAPKPRKQEYVFERFIHAGSSMIGSSIQTNKMRNLENMFLVELIRGNEVHTPVNPDMELKEGDVLVFSGDPAFEHILQQFDCQLINQIKDSSISPGAPLTEVVVSPSSSLVGMSLKRCQFRSKFNAAVIAIKRGDQSIRGKLGSHVLQAGDSMLLATGNDFFANQELHKEFLIVTGVEREKNLGFIPSLTLIISFVAVLMLSVLSYVPLIKGLMFLLAACIVMNWVSLKELKAKFPFEIIIVVGSALGLAQAMFEVGLAQILANALNVIIMGKGPMLALIAVYILTWLVTELVTNNAAAALMFPIAYATSETLGVSPYPFIMALAFAASASFISPYGYQTNLMVYSAGNYKPLDYLKAGVPVLLVYSVVALTLIPLVFPF